MLSIFDLRTVSLTLLFALSFDAHSDIIQINTNQWNSANSPSSNRLSANDVWTATQLNTPTKTANSSGSLISDFSLVGDFLFSAKVTPTIADNASCGQQNENSCNDNDLVGFVFGWQNDANHFRLGFGQGGLNDVTGRDTLFLVEELAGKSNTLIGGGGSSNTSSVSAKDPAWSVYWQENETYDFSVERLADIITVEISGVARTEPGTQSSNPDAEPNSNPVTLNLSYQFQSNAIIDGRIGIYTESQTAIFSDFFVDGTIKPVPAPSTLLLLLLSLLIVAKNRIQKLKLSAGLTF